MIKEMGKNRRIMNKIGEIEIFAWSVLITLHPSLGRDYNPWFLPFNLTPLYC